MQFSNRKSLTFYQQTNKPTNQQTNKPTNQQINKPMTPFKKKKYRKAVALFATLGCLSFGFSSTVRARMQIPGYYGTTSDIMRPAANALPLLKEGGILKGVAGINKVDKNNLVIEQNKERAIIEWDKFNIGSDASTHFDQKGNKDWAALNRIYDHSPSRIYGKLSADGKIYLINQNGILFGPGSQVNVHSLVASSLNVSDDDFEQGVVEGLKFNLEDYQGTGSADYQQSVVANHGTINNKGSGGRIYLLAPRVENYGSINSPGAKVVLAAGVKLEITYDTDGNPVIDRESGDSPAIVRNGEGAEINAKTGFIGMYGREVYHDSVLKVETSVLKKGVIEIKGDDKVITGSDSLISCNINDSEETVHEAYPEVKGRIDLSGDVIAHHGDIRAPSGNVLLNGDKRVFLESGSSIDVKGIWVDGSASDTIVEVKLNSEELKDDQGQKGSVLQGATIEMDQRTGSAIGDVEPYLAADSLTAFERNMEGGTITLLARSGEVIAKQGTSLDFSGGGIHYCEAGVDQTTKLVSGNKIYDISDAPQWLKYDDILNIQETQNKRWGVTRRFEGIYTGGAAPVRVYSAGFDSGSNAGSLRVEARRALLNGKLDGSVIIGAFQDQMDDDFEGETLGRKIPEAGYVFIGSNASAAGENLFTTDRYINEIAIREESQPLLPNFGWDPEEWPYPEDLGGKTILSATGLNNAGIHSLTLSTNSKCTIAPDAGLRLQTGGEFQIIARQIDMSGRVHAPSGNVDLSIRPNITSSKEEETYIDLSGNENIRLASGSLIDVSGERVDNSFNGWIHSALPETARTKGGSVTIQDQFRDGGGVIIAENAVIDVSGGYEIQPGSIVKGGPAGKISLQGSPLVIDGDLCGYSLPGMEGGSITLHTNSIVINESGKVDPEPETDSEYVFAFSSDRFDQSGFSHITLKSVNDLIMDKGMLMPSLVKFALPEPGDYEQRGQTGLTAVSINNQGPASVALSAGELMNLLGLGPQQEEVVDSRLFIKDEARVTVGPNGIISVKAPEVTLAGTMTARSGEISLTATQRDLVLESTSGLFAQGINQRISSDQYGIPDDVLINPGGSVALCADSILGSVILEPGSVVDVSGAGPVTRMTAGIDGALKPVTEASNAGLIEVSYGLDFVENGRMAACTDSAAFIKGGALKIGRHGFGGMEISQAALDHYAESGFEDLAFASIENLLFTDSIDFGAARGLVLDAPEISVDGETDVVLNAPLFQIKNSAVRIPGFRTADPGEGSFEISSDWLDIEGSIVFSGFKDVTMTASKDIAFKDNLYGIAPRYWEGLLETCGDLLLKASRIYPTTLTDFTIHTKGKFTTESAGQEVSHPPYSAGGRLVIEALDIEHKGMITAPMGRIELKGTGDESRIYLADTSIISTAGKFGVNYGQVEKGMFWVIPAKENASNNQGILMPGPLQGHVKITGKEVIVSKGARIDVSGGGSVFGYEFLPGLDGTFDPLTKSGRYIIVPDKSTELPGESIYLYGADPGYYSLLPPEYAFYPGALVLTELDTDFLTGHQSFFMSGRPVVYGHDSDMITGAVSPELKAFSVRSASEVMGEGHFTVMSAESGNAGGLTIEGETTILDGKLKAVPLPGYHGSTLALAAGKINITPNVTPLPSNFTFETDLDDVDPLLKGALNVTAETLASQPFEEIKLGFVNVIQGTGEEEFTTDSITVNQGSRLTGKEIGFIAKESINVASGAAVETETTLMRTPGILTVDGAWIHTTDTLTLDLGEIVMNGEISTDKALSLASDNLIIASEEIEGLQEGLLITQTFLSDFASLDQVSLTGRDKLVFMGDATLDVGGELILNTPLISKIFDTDINVSVSAEEIIVNNTMDECDDQAGSPATGSVINLAAGQITIGHGDIDMQGFNEVSFQSRNDLLFNGKGSLDLNFDEDGALNLDGPRIAVSAWRGEGDDYEASDFYVDAGPGSVNITNSLEGLSEEPLEPGGSLQIVGRRIDHHGVIEVPAGRIVLDSPYESSQGVHLYDGSKILARGGRYENETAFGDISIGVSGGKVLISSAMGGVRVDDGALISVSADAGENGGMLEISGPDGGVDLSGEIEGHGVVGGSFVLDTDVIVVDDNVEPEDPDIEESGIDRLFAKLKQSGFSNALDITARNGNLTVDRGVEVGNVKITAKNGDLTVNGLIFSQAADQGGNIELSAGNDLTIGSTGVLVAKGNERNDKGGDIHLNTVNGELAVLQGSELDVSGKNGGRGGAVWLRAPRKEDEETGDAAMLLEGNVTGASRVVVEAVKVYSHAGDIESSDINVWKVDTEQFMDLVEDVEDNDSLTTSEWTAANPDTRFHFLPGLEIRSAGDLNLADEWDLTGWRYNGEPGVLRLVSENDLNINGNLVDAPHLYTELRAGEELDSWTIGLTALNNLVIEDGKWVYTESAPLWFFSGNNTEIGSGNPAQTNDVQMIKSGIHYNLGTYDGTISGQVGKDLNIKAGAIQAATGDIDIKVGGNLVLDRAADYSGSGTSVGSIRTTGEPPLVVEDWYGTEVIYIGNLWESSEGGDIILQVDGNVMGEFPASNKPAWDKFWRMEDPDVWSASYEGHNATEGIAAMGGGDITIDVGGDFLAQAGTFSTGDLKVTGKGNLDGRFLVREGAMGLYSLGNIGTGKAGVPIEAFDAGIEAVAMGTIELGAVVNPMLVHSVEIGVWDLQYSKDTEVKLTAVTGDVSLTGKSFFYRNMTDSAEKRYGVLPPTVEINAGRDINISGDYVLAPASHGLLTLNADRDINGLIAETGKRSFIKISDMDPADIYGLQNEDTENAFISGYTYSEEMNKIRTPEKVTIHAGRDILDLLLYSPKETEIRAGRDINDLYFRGQNLNDDDVTIIKAGEDIVFSAQRTATLNTGIELGGPGSLVLQAGNFLDLGTSEGVSTIGSNLNHWLGDHGSDLYIVAGTDKEITPEDVETFIHELRSAGVEYSGALSGANGDSGTGAEQLIEDTRENVIAPFFEGAEKGVGTINMTESKINTDWGLDNIFIISTGDFNVGKTTFPEQGVEKNTGVYTSAGGGINVYADGDINVNESRMMTFRGGDITAWSDMGNINAGRGSKTAVSAERGTLVRDRDTGLLVMEFKPPSVGSGIRAVTYDPDGVEGPLEPPLAGDIYLFAPEGVIDAGEAGIAGRNITLAATQVLNTANISASGQSVGVPAAGGDVGMAALSGQGGVSASVMDDKAAAGLDAARERMEAGMAQLEDSFKLQWVGVEVVGFE